MKTSRPCSLLALAALLALSSPALFAQAAPLLPPSTGAAAAGGAAKAVAPADKKFIKDVGKSFFYELQLADLAKNGASSAATKDFAKLVNDELNKAWAPLTELAKDKGETLPIALAGGDKGFVERLKKMKGEAYDKTFFREILKEAKGAERDFEAIAKLGADPAVKSFASEFLPVIKAHVVTGEKAEKEVGRRP